MSGAWVRVGKARPCPVCGHADWCGVSADGAVCHCMRIESAKPCPSGGWIHRLADGPAAAGAFVRPVRPARPRVFDAERTMAGFRAEFGNPGDGDLFDSLLRIADDLRMVAADIDRLGVGMSRFHGAWAFPMLDGEGRCVGIRLRQFGSSRKWSVAGSRDGLFYDPALVPAERVERGLAGRELVVVEGATDCIAGYALGLPCVGRSSCGTGVDALRTLCGRLKVDRVTIVSDNDAYKRRADGTAYRPGVDGARRLADALGRTYRIVTPPKKDLREWLAAGLTARSFWSTAGLQPWRRSGVVCAGARATSVQANYLESGKGK